MHRDGLGHAGAVRERERHRSRAGADEHAVGMAMVTPGELENRRPFGERTRDAYGGHHGLGPGRDHAQPLDRRHRLTDRAPELDLPGRRCAEAESGGRGLLNGLHDSRMRVAGDRGAPGADQIAVRLAVGVGDGRAAAAHQEQRRPPDVAPRTNGAVHPARKEAHRLVVQLRRESHRHAAGRAPLWYHPPVGRSTKRLASLRQRD